MSAPTPGRGWTEITTDAQVPEDAELLIWEAPMTVKDNPMRRWILNPPPPLPTAAPTIITVTAGPAAGSWTFDGMGWRKDGTTESIPTNQLQPDVDAFDITAEPRSATATAVLTDVRAAAPTIDLDPIASTYGATLPQAAP